MANFDDIIRNRYMDKNDHEFETCSVCQKTLLPEDMYVISKAFDKGKCVMSASQCLPCQMSSRGYASEQSMENVMLYSGRRFNQFLEDSIQRKTYHLEDPSCLVTGELLEQQDSFELYTFNIPGVGLQDENFLFIGPTAMEQMAELLSEETRKSWGRFTESLSPDMPDVVISPMFVG